MENQKTGSHWSRWRSWLNKFRWSWKAWSWRKIEGSWEWIERTRKTKRNDWRRKNKRKRNWRRGERKGKENLWLLKNKTRKEFLNNLSIKKQRIYGIYGFILNTLGLNKDCNFHLFFKKLISLNIFLEISLSQLFFFSIWSIRATFFDANS